jgi:hypothetical protein
VEIFTSLRRVVMSGWQNLILVWAWDKLFRWDFRKRSKSSIWVKICRNYRCVRKLPVTVNLRRMTKTFWRIRAQNPIWCHIREKRPDDLLSSA